jgi:putative ABC transport system permease protein
LFEFEREAILLAWNSLKERKLRSFLTILGISIGVLAIISLVSIGEGLRVAVTKQIEQLGANKILVMPFAEMGPQAMSGSYFEQKDVNKIEKVRGVKLVAPFLMKTLEVEFGGEKKLIMVTGTEPEKTQEIFEKVQGYELEDGRFLTKKDKSSVVLGNSVAHNMFSSDLEIGDRIKIANKDFRVVGILKEVGNRIDDNTIILPLNVMRELTGEEKEITMIMVEAKSSNEVKKTAERIQETLEDYRKKGTFAVLTTEQLSERMKNIGLVLTIFLGGIAAISLIVAGIGIANTMIMSVMERTREIGIMKAIGATNRNIMKIFLMESVLISLIGGVIGCILGIGGATTLSRISFFQGTTLRTTVTPELLVFGLIFSVTIGVLFGLWPAYKASRLNPVEALRYE